MSRLPNGYIELEYIESTGGQYIDTGFTWETSTKIDFTIERLGDNAGQTTGTSRANVWFGANGNTGTENMLGWGASGNSNYFRGGTGGSYYVLPLNTKTNITFDYTKGAMKLFVNGVQDGGGSTRDTVTTSKILLGGVVDITTGAPILFCLERFYENVKLWNGETLVADFIPAKRISDSAIGMYDTVSQSFFTNAGTGNFIAGPIAMKIEKFDSVIAIQGKNLFDGVSNLVLGKYINYNTGDISTDANNFYCEIYFEVKPNISYVFWGNKKLDNTISRFNRLHFYDNEKNYISGITASANTKCFGVTPADTKYIRFSCNVLGSETVTTEVINEFNWYLGEGNAMTSYEPYRNELVRFNSVIAVQGKNLFNKSTALVGYLINDSGQVVTDNGSACSGEFIPVKPNTQYTYSCIGRERDSYYIRIHFYNANKEWIKMGVKTNKSDISANCTTEVDTAYIKVSGSIETDVVQLEEGSTATPYEPYGNELVRFNDIIVK